MFIDRREAGLLLLEQLPPLDPKQTVVLALPRGGLPVADVIADALGAPLDIVLVRKIGCPGQPELAVAAITDGDDPDITLNEGVARTLGVNPSDVRELAEAELQEIHRRRVV